MYPYSPLLQAIFSAGARHPEKVALVAGQERVSYAQLCRRSRQAAAFIQSKGYRVGDVLRLAAVKEPPFVYMVLGAMMVGVIAEFIDPQSALERFHYLPEEIEGMSPLAEAPAGLKETDVIEIIHTTGTTARPKLVCLSHYNVYWAARYTSDAVQNDEHDVEVVAMPLCHGFGLRRLYLSLMHGATAILLPNIANVRLLLNTIETYQVTTLALSPAAWRYIRQISGTRIAKYAGQLRQIEFGTSALSLETKHDVLTLFPDTRIYDNYGLTESNRSTSLELHDTAHLDSIGRPIADSVTVQVIDGEICVRGRQTMVGYWDAEDNEGALVDGLVRTGDCGAFILKGSTTLTFEQIDDRLRAILPPFKCPTLYAWITQIPVNSLGKKQRTSLSGK